MQYPTSTHLLWIATLPNSHISHPLLSEMLLLLLLLKLLKLPSTSSLQAGHARNTLLVVFDRGLRRQRLLGHTKLPYES